MTVDYLSLISKHTQGEHPRTVPALIIHSALVTKKALDIGFAYKKKHPEAEIDFRLLEEMGMLHDIGIFSTNTPMLHTTGEGAYITHITHGARILEDEGLSKHARAALSHTAISKEEIIEQDLDLPPQDFVPQTIEEELLCLADFFYSKRFETLFHEHSPQQIEDMMRQYGEKAAKRFVRLAEKYL